MRDQDVTARLLADLPLGARAQTFATKAKPARAGKLTSTQQAVADRLAGTRLEYVSRPLMYARAIHTLGAREQRAAISLFRGGVLRVVQVWGPLNKVQDCRPSEIGADCLYHYRIERNEETSDNA